MKGRGNMAGKKQEERQEKKTFLPWYRFKTDFLGMMERATPEQVKEAVCKATRYAYQYGENGDEIEASIQDPVALLLYGALKQGADESIVNHKAKIAGGKSRAEQRKAEIEEKDRLINAFMEKNGGDEAEPFTPQFMRRAAGYDDGEIPE